MAFPEQCFGVFSFPAFPSHTESESHQPLPSSPFRLFKSILEQLSDVWLKVESYFLQRKPIPAWRQHTLSSCGKTKNDNPSSTVEMLSTFSASSTVEAEFAPNV